MCYIILVLSNYDREPVYRDEQSRSLMKICPQNTNTLWQAQ